MPCFILSVDLSTESGSIAIHRTPPEGAPELISDLAVEGRANHVESFLATLDHILRKSKVHLGQIRCILTTSGPGSFTGLRVAYAAIKGMAFHLPISIETMGSPEVRAISWARNTPCKGIRLEVLSQIKTGSFLKNSFTAQDNGTVIENGHTETHMNVNFLRRQHGDSIFLLDTSLWSQFSETLGAEDGFFHHPLRARYLGMTRLQASSRKCYCTKEEWFNLNPNYFGDNRFGFDQ